MANKKIFGVGIDIEAVKTLKYGSLSELKAEPSGIFSHLSDVDKDAAYTELGKELGLTDNGSKPAKQTAAATATP